VTPDRVLATDIDETPGKGELPAPRGPPRRGKGARRRRWRPARWCWRAIPWWARADASCPRRKTKPPRAPAWRCSPAAAIAFSAVAAVTPDGTLHEALSETIVRFKRFTQEETDGYIASGEWRGKAGGYAIQGSAEGLCLWLSGSHSGVMGLPLYETRLLLRRAGFRLAEWLHEAGIGEERAILVDRGEIIAARVDWGETLRPGFIGPAQVIVKHKGARRGIARFADGGEALVDGLDPAVTEGATVLLRVTRAAIAEKGRTKLPQARAAAADAAPPLHPACWKTCAPAPCRSVRCRSRTAPLTKPAGTNWWNRRKAARSPLPAAASSSAPRPR
jgi:septum formation protein